MIVAEEQIEYRGRKVHMKWHESFIFPNTPPITQVFLLCLNNRKEVMLAKKKNGEYTLPGGHPQKNETPIETFTRETHEEICATFKEPQLLGYTEVFDPDNKEKEGYHYLQLRYAATLERLEDFQNHFETVGRIFVPVEDLTQYLPWIQNSIGKSLIESLQKFINREKLLKSIKENKGGLNIAIPVFNEERNLRRCIEKISRATQCLPDFYTKTYICMNGCTDTTPHIAKELQGECHDLHIQILNLPQRNMFLAEKAIINIVDDDNPIIFIDADTEIHKKALSTLIAQFEKHKELLIVGGHAFPIENSRYLDKIFNCRAYHPMAEISRNDVSNFHPFAHADPQCSITPFFEERSKIYFHGRFFAVRTKKIWGEALFEKRIGDDTFLTYNIYHKYGIGTIRVSYDAIAHFHPINSFAKHYRTYRRIFLDLWELFRDHLELKQFEPFYPTTLNWNYINGLSVSWRVAFIIYSLVCVFERILFVVSPKKKGKRFWAQET